MIYEVQSEQKQTPSTGVKLNIRDPGVFTYHPNNFYWTTGPDNSKSRCSNDQECPTDKKVGQFLLRKICAFEQ